jgi:glycosyltransferase involved in cell wall biosynthesis
MLSIITPVYNGSVFIEQTIKSILKLNIEYEHIIVDGGSTDGTLDVVKKYSHIKLIHQTDDEGMYKAIDIGLNFAKGDYVTWINSDDRIIPSNYEILYKCAIEQKASLIYSDALYHFIDDCKYEYVPALPFARYFLKNGIVPFVQPSCIFLKSFYHSVGGLNYARFRIIGDRDLFQRFSYVKKSKIIHTPLVTVVFLRYKNSLFYRELDKAKQERRYTIKTNDSMFNKFLLHLLRSVIKIYRRPFR